MADASPVLPTPGVADEDDVLLLRDEVELGELFHDRGVDAWLRGEGEGLERPALRQASAADPVLEALLPLKLVLLAQHSRVEVRVARLGFLRASELALDNVAHVLDTEGLEKLFDVVVHDSSFPSSFGGKRKYSPAICRRTRTSSRSML